MVATIPTLIPKHVLIIMIEINELKIGNKIELIVAKIEVINKHFFRPIVVARYGPTYEPKPKQTRTKTIITKKQK
jgi:hypothetical protein